MRVKQELNNVLRGTWMVEMMNAPSADCPKFCYGFFCPCCFSYQQRGQILDITGEPYVCCGGSCPCCMTPCSDRNPWMCLEACCCTHVAILSNRYMIQTRFDIRNDPCDESLIAFTAAVNLVIDLIEPCMNREAAQHARTCVDCLNAVVCSCMLTQQDAELRRIEEGLAQDQYQGPPAHVIMILPPAQQNMIQAAQAFRGAGQPAQPAAAPGGAPVPATMQSGLVAQGRQIMVTVPPATTPGQTVMFTSPEGVQQQVVVPPGYAPGQQFLASY